MTRIGFILLLVFTVPFVAHSALSAATPTKVLQQPTNTPELLTGTVTAEVLSVRGGPGTDYSVVGQLYKGDVVVVVGRNSDTSWLNVTGEKVEGWVSAKYVDVSGDVSTVPVTTPEAIAVQEPTETTMISRPPDLPEAQVVEVVDGDTIKVDIDRQVVNVRYIGVDAPEAETAVEWMGPEASAKNAELVSGKVVGLEKDVSETDEYGNLLRYVWVDDLMVNAELVRLGYAVASTHPPDVKYQDWFIQLEREAKEAGRGLWSAPPEPTATAEPTSNCSPCYPDVCIPPPPPDLDCGDVSYRRFTVLCDPHGFDRDKNGIGCER